MSRKIATVDFTFLLCIMSKISLHIIYTKTCGTRSQGIEDREPRLFSRHYNSVPLAGISSGNPLQKGGVHLVGLDLRLRCGRAATNTSFRILQKGGVPAAPSGTATLLRLSPNHQFHLRPPLAVTDFRCPRLSWLDGRCVQGPGTYSPRHG